MISLIRILLVLSCGVAQATDVVDYSDFTKRPGGIATAWVAGADGVEIDVRVSTDGVAYVFHDSLIEMPGLDGRSYSDIVEAYAYDLPKLSALLGDVPHSGYFVFDLRIPDTERASVAIAAIRLSRIPVDKVVIQSDNFDVLAEVRELWPEVRRSYASSAHGIVPFVAPSSSSELVNLLSINEIDRVSLKGRLFLNAEFINSLKLRGVEVHVWTINLGSRIEHYLLLGVDGIVSKRPAAVTEKIDRFISEATRPRTAMYPLARYATTDPNLRNFAQIRKSLVDDASRFDTVYYSPQPSHEPAQVNCRGLRRLGVLLEVVHTLQKADYASELAWSNRVGSSVVKFNWTHSAYPEDDRIFYSRSRLWPRSQSYIFADSIKLKQKQRQDGKITVKITKNDVALYETSFELVGCENVS